MRNALNPKIIEIKATNLKQIRHNYILPRIIHIMFQILIACFVINVSASDFDISNSKTKINGETATVSFDFKRPTGIKVESVNLIAACKDDTFGISRLMPETVKNALLNDASGNVSFNVPIKYFPRGQNCEFKLKTNLVSGKPNRVLQIKDSRAGLVLKDIQGSDLEIKLRFRYIGDMGGSNDLKRFMICLRTETGVCWGRWPKWKFCMLDFLNGKDVKLERIHLRKWQCLGKAPFSYSDGKWHNATFRIKGKQYEANIDNRIKLSGVESENFSSKGGVGLGVFQAGFWVDDITVTDLSLNKVIYEDNFEREKIIWGKRWKTKASGNPSFGNVDDSDAVIFIKNETRVVEAKLGSVQIPPLNQNAPSLPNVEVKQYGAGVLMEINGKPFLPLAFSAGDPAYTPLNEDSYAVMGKMYKRGLRLYMPLFKKQMTWNANNECNFKSFDQTIRRMLLACPESYILPRFLIPPPLNLPKGDFLRSGLGLNDKNYTQLHSASLSSKDYRKAYCHALKKFIEHIKLQPYRDRIIGTYFIGGGYESNWGQVYGKGGLYIDVSPVMAKSFSAYAIKKYKTPEALRTAWGMPALDVNNIPVPGLEHRTLSDIAGFRNPSKPTSRWITDFFEFYGTESVRNMLLPSLNNVQDFWPGGFFGACVSRSHYASFGAQNMQDAQDTLCDHPAFKFAVGVMHYAERKNGDVSFYTNSMEESLRLRGKLSIGEVDMRTHRARPSGHREASAYDTSQTMWREFGRLALVLGQGLYYFGSSRSGSWWDDEDILDTLQHQIRIGKTAIKAKIEDANIAKVLVVMDNYSWKYFGSTPERLKGIDEKSKYMIGNSWIKSSLVRDLAHIMHNKIMRMGAAKNYIFYEDFLEKDMNQYKLFIFPSTFYCDKKARKRIHALVENGATVMFFFGAGIVNGANSSLQNMSELLEMNIAVAPPGKLEAKIVKNNHPLCLGINPGTVVGNKRAEWHRFYIDDPTATALACYDDGKVAVAVKKLGKGNIIYSAVPILLPAIYRDAAQVAGAHVYSDQDEALYASKRFLVVNTSDKSAGERNFKLPEKVPAVYEVISGRLIAKDVDHFKDELKDKETVIYYLGKNQQFIEAIKSNAKMKGK